MDASLCSRAGRALLYWTFLQLDLEPRRGRGTGGSRRPAGPDDPGGEGLLSDRVSRSPRTWSRSTAARGYQALPRRAVPADARIAMIYEGTNGVQALDLVGRSWPPRRPRHHCLPRRLRRLRRRDRGRRYAQALAEGLRAAKGQLQDASLWLMQNGNGQPDNAGAGLERLPEHGGADRPRLMCADGQGRGRHPRDPFSEAKLKTALLPRPRPARGGMHLAS